MNELMQADIQYLAEQKPEQMQLILSGMAATMQDIESKVEAMQSQNWFQRMVKTVTGKNKLTRDEIRQKHGQLNMYMAEAVAELYHRNKVNGKIIVSLGTQINEIYSDICAIQMDQEQTKEMMGAFAVRLNNKIENSRAELVQMVDTVAADLTDQIERDRVQFAQMLGAVATKLNEKIESVDNFHMFVTEIDQGVYTNGVSISNICKVLSQFDRRILEDSRKLNIIRRALEKQEILREEPVTLADYFADVLSIPMSEAGQVYMELGTMRGSAIAPLTMKMMESYHFLPDLARRMKNRKNLIDKIIRDEDLDTSITLSTVEIYEDFVNSKMDVQSGLLLPAADTSDSGVSGGQGLYNAPANVPEEPLYTGDINEISAKEKTQNIERYRRAAERGSADGQCLLGICYEDGNGVAKDYTQAAYWYRKAAEQGHVNAQYKLGDCYFSGYGVKRDHYQAVQWYRKAAEQGHADAQHELGFCYHVGDGVVQDYYQAVQWYRKAAEQGHVQAQESLGACYHVGKGVAQDYNQAVYWYSKAAEQGDEEAEYLLWNLQRR